MLEDESGKRISSFEVANELKSIKNEVGTDYTLDGFYSYFLLVDA